ncbi:hypothetical protein JHW43_002282 [Diplocarpon mali]|nr:hypothetical protein JHW43_002282 [Diplocarpon mali]
MDDKDFYYRGSEPSEISTKLCVFFIKSYCKRGRAPGGCPDVHDPNARKEFVEAKKARAAEAKKVRELATEKDRQKACREKQQGKYDEGVSAAKAKSANKLLAARTVKSNNAEPVSVSKSANTTAKVIGNRKSNISHSKPEIHTPVPEIAPPAANDTSTAAPRVPRKRSNKKRRPAQRTQLTSSPQDSTENTVEDHESTAVNKSKSATTKTGRVKAGNLAVGNSCMPAVLIRGGKQAPEELAEPIKLISSVISSMPKANSTSKYKQDREAAADFQRFYIEKQRFGRKPTTAPVGFHAPTPSSDTDVTTTNTSTDSSIGRSSFSGSGSPRSGADAELNTTSMMIKNKIVQRPEGMRAQNAHCKYFSAGNCRKHLCPFIHDYKHRHAAMDERSIPKITRRNAADALEASTRVSPVHDHVSLDASSVVAPVTACANVASAEIPTELMVASSAVLEAVPVKKAWNHDEARAWANTNLRIKGSQIAYARLLAPYIIENRMSEIPYELLVGRPISREEGGSFPSFGLLPRELRDCIWDSAVVDAISERRTVRVEFMTIENRPYVISRTSAPALLHTCKGSRALAMKHFNYAFRTPVPKPLGVYFNLTTDQLFINARGPEDFKWVCLCIAPEDRHQIKHLELPIKDYIRHAEKFIRRLCTFFPLIQTLTVTAGDSTLDQMCVRRGLARKLTGCISTFKERWMRRSGLGAESIPKVRVATVSALLANKWGIDDLQYCG